MKLATYRNREGAVRTGVVLADERVLDVSDWIAALPLPREAVERQQAVGLVPPAGGILRWLLAGDGRTEALGAHVRERLAVAAAGERLADVRLLAPVPRPGKVVGVGRNYDDHAKEIGSGRMERPKLLFKVPSSVVGPGAAVARPAGVHKLDFEVELAAVMGAWARNVSVEQALATVAGYTIVNDLSAREYQFDYAPAQTSFAKSMDGFTPMGPWLVTADEIPDPQALALSLRLNGATMQEGSTAGMLFTVAELVSYLSRFMTLEPGDVVATGTPAGVGAFRQPPVYLAPGDRLRLEIGGIGVLEHFIANPAP